jgi:hypothetical protein
MWPTHYIPNQPRIEGEPPPRIYLTSCPYPYEMSESLASAGEFTSATPGEEATEEMESSGSFVSGTMVTYGFQTHEMLDEEIESSGSFVSGSLVDRLRFMDAGRDELESAGSFVSGFMTDPLIFYENWPLEPDELESSGSFVSGVLT